MVLYNFFHAEVIFLRQKNKLGKNYINLRKGELLMKKTAGIMKLLQLMGLCFSLLIFCSVSFAEQLDSRWQYVCTSENMNFYLDTQTVEYDSNKQIAKFWYKSITQGTSFSMDTLLEITYKSKCFKMSQICIYKNNKPSVSKAFNGFWSMVIPDSPIEALADKAASELHINFLYDGGPDRWLWIHSNDEYGLYIAKDTLRHHPHLPRYIVWAKRQYLNGKNIKRFYEIDFTDQTIFTPFKQNHQKQHPVPESDEEYIYNFVKNIAKAKGRL